MKRARVWSLLAVYLGAWFFPVVRDPEYTPRTVWLPGWDAFLVALGLHDSDPSFPAVASALTNGLMVAAVTWLLRAPHHRPPPAAPWLVPAAALLNLTWARPGDTGFHFGVGYWIWVSSFALASGLLFSTTRRGGAGTAA